MRLLQYSKLFCLKPHNSEITCNWIFTSHYLVNDGESPYHLINTYSRVSNRIVGKIAKLMRKGGWNWDEVEKYKDV